MFVENVKSQTRSVGDVILLPAMNRIADEKWDSLLKSKQWGKPIKGMIADGTLIVHDKRTKLTVEMVNKTYDVALLKEWRETAKGVLLGAIRKQLEALDIEKDL